MGWPSEGSLDRSLVSKVWHKVTCKPGHPDQFLYIDTWLQLVLELPTSPAPQWLRQQQHKRLAEARKDQQREKGKRWRGIEAKRERQRDREEETDKEGVKEREKDRDREREEETEAKGKSEREIKSKRERDRYTSS